MTRTIQDKYLALSLEFDRYYMSHLVEVSDQLPRTSTIVVAIEGDEDLNAYSRSIVRNFNRRAVMEVRKIKGSWRITPLTKRARAGLIAEASHL